MWRNVISALTILACSASPAYAVEVGGGVAIESRYFVEGPASNAQIDGLQSSLVLEPEFQFQSENGVVWRVAPFLRVDSRDSQRTHSDVREASAEFIEGNWDVLVGVSRVFWGVTESRHLVNVVNQVDVFEGLDEESFLGQPMVRVGVQGSWGRVESFLMTGFRERSTPALSSRLRPLVHIVDEPIYDNSAEQGGIDAALRYSQFFGRWDIATSFFYGTSREPRYALNYNGNLVPHYDSIRRAGVELQYTKDAWLWKLESIVQDDFQSSFSALVAGVEKTHYQVLGSGADIGLLAEYLYDGRGSSAPITAFNNDMFVGLRVAANDLQDTSVLAGGVVDLEDGSRSFRLEVERRVGQNYRIELEAQYFSSISSKNVLSAFENDSYLTLSLKRYF